MPGAGFGDGLQEDRGDSALDRQCPKSGLAVAVNTGLVGVATSCQVVIVTLGPRPASGHWNQSRGLSELE